LGSLVHECLHAVCGDVTKANYEYPRSGDSREERNEEDRAQRALRLRQREEVERLLRPERTLQYFCPTNAR
jgi:hypothetical protein